MIDQIKNKINNLSNSAVGSEKAEVKQSKAQVQKVEHSITKNKVDVDGGKVSQFVNKETIKNMAKQPPIDKISTNRIKSAIANGSYPLDLDKIADALFDAYKEMKD
jgi:negative regulator of flagellin synthesis FlgM